MDIEPVNFFSFQHCRYRHISTILPKICICIYHLLLHGIYSLRYLYVCEWISSDICFKNNVYIEMPTAKHKDSSSVFFHEEIIAKGP